MKQNVAFSVGNLAIIDKSDAEMGGYFERVFGKVGGGARDFVPCVKLLAYNRLGDCLATNRLKSYPDELFWMLGFKEIPGERSFYRTVERVGKGFELVLKQHQQLIKEHGLVTKEQFMDFSSSYSEGDDMALGEYGYSRDGQPGKKQLVFGISTGINGIPTAITIQKGNTNDAKHMDFMLRAAEAVLERESLLIFDCGANSKKNKATIRAMGFHYLTLKPKKRGAYRAAIAAFRAGPRQTLELNGRTYECVKTKCDSEYEYVFFSDEREQEQLANKAGKFQKELKRNEPLLKRTKAGKPLDEYPCNEGTIIAKGSLQKALGEMANPLINGLEGFFVLESSVDAEPRAVLALYKDRDKAEKLIRNIKEGTELRPMRHWNKHAVIGYVLLIFLTNFLVSLTLHRAKSSQVKNVKLLKKYLTNLTVTVVYPENYLRIRILSNVSPEILSVLGRFVERYGEKTIRLRL